jgi:hypothetical protein
VKLKRLTPQALVHLAHLFTVNRCDDQFKTRQPMNDVIPELKIECDGGCRNGIRRRPQGHQSVTGRFPKLTTTLRAEVLATMLAQDDMIGVESVFASGSTKLATVMRALTRRYRWPVERREFATNMADGTVAWVSMYTLPAQTVARALALGAEEWIAEVRTARLRRLTAPTRRSSPSPFEPNNHKHAWSPKGRT